LCGLPRLNLSSTDAGLLQGFIHLHTRAAWRAAAWPETRGWAQKTTGSAKSFAKGTTIDQILRITTKDPRTTTAYRRVEFIDGGATVYVLEELDSVWVEYLTAAPDILNMSSPTVLTYDIPDRFASAIISLTAGSYLRAVGRQTTGNEFTQLGEAALTDEANAARSLDHSP
jgi:hypothetical protein